LKEVADLTALHNFPKSILPIVAILLFLSIVTPDLCIQQTKK
jgi:hypothetical protein